jgi:chitodextrinase
MHVMWNAVGAGIERYEVYRGTTKVEDVPGSQHMVDVTRLRPATPYVFTVRARDTQGRLGPPGQEARGHDSGGHGGGPLGPGPPR